MGLRSALHAGSPNAGEAVLYGYGGCDKVSDVRSCAQAMNDVKADLTNSDEYQASYLIAQAVNERCRALIGQLRTSGPHYRPAPTATQIGRIPT
jgi:hypothetical protein